MVKKSAAWKERNFTPAQLFSLNEDRRLQLKYHLPAKSIDEAMLKKEHAGGDAGMQTQAVSQVATKMQFPPHHRV